MIGEPFSVKVVGLAAFPQEGERAGERAGPRDVSRPVGARLGMRAECHIWQSEAPVVNRNAGIGPARNCCPDPR